MAKALQDKLTELREYTRPSLVKTFRWAMSRFNNNEPRENCPSAQDAYELVSLVKYRKKMIKRKRAMIRQVLDKMATCNCERTIGNYDLLISRIEDEIEELESIVLSDLIEHSR